MPSRSACGLSAILLAVTLGFVPTASAAPTGSDFCFNSGQTNPQTIVRVKGFKKPGKGSCKPLNGWEITAPVPRMVAGTACMNTAGNTLWVGYLIHAAFIVDPPTIYSIEPLFVTMQLPYPALANAPVFLQHQGGGGSGEISGFAGPCGFPQSIP